ncbi:trehalose-phosphatase [Erythrobacter sp. R86502]|uniref:trehalose-phosphatase n=1 Tax=Erythrobacter sp. R86502 TaxID=3093846 RepID=UPI0036D32A5F
MSLFLDFDGTLIEIAEGPDAIAVPADLGARLERLACRLDGRLAIVSGRGVDNLTRFLGPVPLYLAGSHGADVRAPLGATLRVAEPLPESVAERLRLFAADNGLLYENKPHGAALHYRARPDFEDTALRFAENLAAEHAMAIKTGKCVVEMMQPGADKGGAVDLLGGQSPFAGATPVFLGDDMTDEDGFAACERRGGFGIAVGDRVSQTARYSLGTVKDVIAWLEL